MSEHKFEPFDRVLVRGVTGIWLPDLYGCKDEGIHPEKHLCTGGISYADIVPYTPETAHLLGTTQPYEPPKPPHEYKWGDRVEVMQNGVWVEGICVDGLRSSAFEGVGWVVVLKGKITGAHYPPDRIRSLGDSQ